jgi:NAD(P)-dependent dehydrogenase (short-subunit alcohol dehydrogenase family)
VKRLEGKTAIVTGGASGIGAASVRLFAQEGARVLVADMQRERGEKLAAELGPAAAFRAVDVTREDDVKGAVEEAVSRWGRLDCLYNNAGFAPRWRDSRRGSRPISTASPRRR